MPARRFLGWAWPDPPPLPERGGPATRAAAVLRDGAGWRALCYCLLRLPMTAVVAYLGVAAIVAGVASVTFPAWWWLAPLGHSFAGAWLQAAGGLPLLLLFPWYFRLMVRLDRWLVRALLEPSPDQGRIAALESSRAALRADAAALLRLGRLEGGGRRRRRARPATRPRARRLAWGDQWVIQPRGNSTAHRTSAINTLLLPASFGGEFWRGTGWPPNVDPSVTGPFGPRTRWTGDRRVLGRTNPHGRRAPQDTGRSLW